MTAPVRRRLVGCAISAASVTLVTGAIELLKHFIPVLSLGVLYVIAVLVVAIPFGMGFAMAVAVASMLAFNFFFLPPLYTFTLQDSTNWFALLVFVVTAIVVSELATRSRRRARESELLAEVATSLLERGTVRGELERIASQAAAALQVEAAHIDLGPAASPGYPLEAGGRRVGTIRLERPRPRSETVRRRLLPALASLLGVAIDRQLLAQEALEAEALRRSDAVKTAVLRAVSHDLRSPLMAILTSAGALSRSDFALEPADRGELVDTILAEAGRLDRLVGNLLDLSRLEAGAAQPETGVWSIDDLLVQALEELGPAGGRVQVTLPDEPPAVRVDLNQVERALANLLENALRYSPEDEPVHIQVSTTTAEVLIRVIDHGRGIPDEELERIFQPFQRGSGTDGVRGAGLGLAIARGFAEANGGRVWAESRSGQGATFVLALPATAAVEVPA